MWIDHYVECCGLRHYYIHSWTDIAKGSGSYTVSPLRRNTYICTDVSCNLHGQGGRPHCNHHPMQMATALELLIVHSFYDVIPDRSPLLGIRRAEFREWPNHELDVACYKSQYIDTVQQTFFDGARGAALMAQYSDLFLEASEHYQTMLDADNDKLPPVTFLHLTQDAPHDTEDLPDTRSVRPGNQTAYTLVTKSLLENTRTLERNFAFPDDDAVSHHLNR